MNKNNKSAKSDAAVKDLAQLGQTVGFGLDVDAGLEVVGSTLQLERFDLMQAFENDAVSIRDAAENALKIYRASRKAIKDQAIAILSDKGDMLARKATMVNRAYNAAIITAKFHQMSAFEVFKSGSDAGLRIKLQAYYKEQTDAAFVEEAAKIEARRLALAPAVVEVNKVDDAFTPAEIQEMLNKAEELSAQARAIAEELKAGKEN